MWTRDLATADASCGGKAHGLAKLHAAGLRVPAGFVIDHRAFRIATGDVVRNTTDPTQAVIEPDPGISLRLRPEAVGHTLDELARTVETIELPQDLVDEVAAHARALGGPFAVRSSATIEDSAAGAAAGVFSSRTAVSLEDLWPAIRAVWISALTPLAATYARRRGGEIAIAVIVQRYVPGERVTIYSRPPGAPETDEVWQQLGPTLTKRARRDASVLATIEAALAAPRGVDVELIAQGPEVDLDTAWYVQARPIVHPVITPRTSPPPVVLVALQDGRRWTLDVTHNPDPLSIAQTDLVHRVEAAGQVPWEARVVAGYLYTTPREPGATVAPTEALWPSYTRIALRLAECLDPPPASLEEAVDRYIAFLGHWAELSAAISAHRPAAPSATHRPSSLEAMLLQAARNGNAEAEIAPTIGVFAPSWDVATPTFAERPGLLRDALARARQALPQATPPEVDLDDRAATLNQLVANLAELDDHWFARAQWMIRKAIIDRADALGILREDAFWIPIDDLVAGDLDPVDVRRRASGARAAAARASSWNMPVVVGDPESSTRDPGVALHGIGSGHQLTGRVRRFESLASAIVVGHGDIVVTRAVTPALAVIVIGCAAIISETGRLLDHGAAMARELGIPCVVGCRDAWSQLADGMIVSIDNDRVITR
jgi:phosphohistidine swiveling domain-containing protein